LSESDDDDRTHDPTPQRREKFRKEGQVARSRDAGGVASVLAAGAAIAFTHDSIRRAFEELMRATIGNADTLGRGELEGVRTALAGAALRAIGPPLVAASMAGVIVGFAQAGLHLELDLAAPKAERLNPIAKLGQMLSPKHAMGEIVLALAKVLLVGVVAYRALLDELPALIGLGAADLPTATGTLAAAVVHVGLHAIGAASAIALADYGWSRFQLEKRLKMTLQELKDEMRQEDGDPKVKGRMRARARQLARSRMMNDVKNAAVVVTNPTHVAVALRYDDTDPAPVVVAKGHDHVALAIRREARRAGIPIVESRALARTLDAEVPIGKPSRVEHFAAVAKVLAFVYALRGRKPTARRGAAGPRVARRVQQPLT